MRVFISDKDFKKAAQNGISKNVLRQRVRHLDWDMERATTEPVASSSNRISSEHVFYVRSDLRE